MVHRISTRISLRWLPDPPSEPTDTLVFNVESYFLDLRVLKVDHSIDWAMAGERLVISTDPRTLLSSHLRVYGLLQLIRLYSEMPLD